MWIFSRRTDLLLFTGTALLASVLLFAGRAAGLEDSPEWTWIGAVLLVDVAHVWSTGFLIFDATERREHGRLWLVVPIVAYVVGVGLYAAGGAGLFWRVLAYLAVFHFIRQQWGWVALYRARAGEKRGRLLDAAAVYVAAGYPLVWWHTRPARRFAWFVAGDFVSLPAWIEPVAFWIFVAVLVAYALRSLARATAGRMSPGKDLLVVTTAVTWWLGIVAFDSDYGFTVMNVLVHGVPYLALVFVVARKRAIVTGRQALVWFLGAVWVAAFVEELFWDRTVWHERPWLFGPGWSVEGARPWLVPLLAVPQASHYVLDGFLWRRRHRRDEPLDLRV